MTVIVLGASGAHQCYSDGGCARWKHLLARSGYVEVVPIVVHTVRSIRPPILSAGGLSLRIVANALDHLANVRCLDHQIIEYIGLSALRWKSSIMSG